MPQVFANDAGTLREIAELYVNDGGTLREIKEAYVNDNGTLRQIFSAEAIGGDYLALPAPPALRNINAGGASPQTAQILFQADGTYDEVANGTNQQTWATNAPDTAGGNFFIRWDAVSGTVPSPVGTFNQATYYPLSAVRGLGITRSGGAGITSGVFDITIATSAGGAGAVTRRFNLEAEVVV